MFVSSQLPHFFQGCVDKRGNGQCLYQKEIVSNDCRYIPPPSIYRVLTVAEYYVTRKE